MSIWKCVILHDQQIKGFEQKTKEEQEKVKVVDTTGWQ